MKSCLIKISRLFLSTLRSSQLPCNAFVDIFSYRFFPPLRKIPNLNDFNFKRREKVARNQRGENDRIWLVISINFFFLLLQFKFVMLENVFHREAIIRNLKSSLIPHRFERLSFLFQNVLKWVVGCVKKTNGNERQSKFEGISHSKSYTIYF